MAQSVARRLGKAEVGGSSPLDSFELFPGNARECGVSGVFLISADLRCRSSNLHRFQQKSHCRFSYRFTGLKKKCNSLLRILPLVMKYVILDLIEVVVQGDGFCIRGSRMSEKNYETSELKELKDVLQTFTEFVWEMEEYLPEFYHFFDAMRQNIEIFLRVGEEDEEQIHEILERDWEKAHAPLVGVQCYDFQGSHPEAEAGTCVYFANLLTEIGRFFEPMSMLGVF